MRKSMEIVVRGVAALFFSNLYLIIRRLLCMLIAYIFFRLSTLNACWCVRIFRFCFASTIADTVRSWEIQISRRRHRTSFTSLGPSCPWNNFCRQSLRHPLPPWSTQINQPTVTVLFPACRAVKKTPKTTIGNRQSNNRRKPLPVS